jgi:hypothetical protein
MTKPPKPRPATHRCGYVSWHVLLRQLGIDFETCPRCGRKMKVIALVRDPESVACYLRHLGLPTEEPSMAPGHRDSLGVVALCCRALEDGGMDADGRTKFTEAAWDLITFMVRVLVDPIRARASLGSKARPGEILPVPAKRPRTSA